MKFEDILKQQFGYQSFRPGQKEIIEQLVAGKDVVALLPTGMGKSMCYQLPSYILQQPMIIISPLLSLMQDQVEQMKQFGEKRVIALNSFLSFEQKRQALNYLEQYRFIFISPEMLLQHTIQEKLLTMSLSLIVVDEAHCISQWGYDFRPDYLRIGEVWRQKKRPPILALSATATNEVLKDIRYYLNMHEPFEYIHSVDRTNIHYSKQLFQDKEEKNNWIISHVCDTEGPGIIYTQSRAKTENISQLLLEQGISIAAYHGGMETEDRQFIQQQFIEGELDWIVATNAFGMGVHKGDIRQIIHESIPSNLADYMQEVGRAGRNGQESIAILLYAEGDEEITKYIATVDLPNDFQVDQYEQLIVKRENPQTMMVNGHISETSFRVLEYWMSRLNTEKVKELFKTMQAEKMQAVAEIADLVHTEHCMREKIVNYFGQTVQQRPENCCDCCGLNRDELLEKRKTRLSSNVEWEWQTRLERLLLK